ncbi:serine hydrolase domain-containing protein [Streptomyces sp. NPDC057686]|uniref:serine hydrolase domain-containing protein n=1 Tax=Streptomyces sp. NPDC057686 TaxID=3346212 RepID=UPI00367F8985
MNIRTRICTTVLMLVSLLAGCGPARTDEPPSTAFLDAALERSFAQTGAPGAIVAVQTPEYTWMRAVGVANTATGDAMAPAMHTRIASVTKIFTVTVLLQAAAEGLLSLDDPISRYYPNIPNGDRITLRLLANHRSGIGNYESNDRWVAQWKADPERAWTPVELVAFGIEESPLFPPGTDFRYSNTNTVLIGLVLEQVTGRPVGQLYQERILQPLGLRATAFSGADPSIPRPHPRGYTLFGRSSGADPVDATDWNPSVAWTAGGLTSTAEDLLAFGRAMGTGEGLLPPEQQAERLDSLLPEPGKPETSYGLGLMGMRDWIGHTGEIPGFTATLFYHRVLHATVVVLVNSDVASGGCPPRIPTSAKSRRNGPCDVPANLINAALADALGKPIPPPTT